MDIVYNIAYLLIGIGTAVGVITNDKECHHSLLAIIVVGIFFGALWPVFWSIKITQKLMDA